MAVTIYEGDNLPHLKSWPDASFDFVYVDPPFNTGRRQSHTRLQTVRDDDGDRRGFGGDRYRSIPRSTHAFNDTFEDFLGFLEPRLAEAHRLLKPHGCLFLHLDYREVHYGRFLLDGIFGPARFKNEIIWAYDYGGRSRSAWPAKHDNILWYVKDPKHYTFDFEAMDRIPYMAPGLVGKEKAARGKTPTDVWWHTIVPTNGRERTGYPTQKPLGILERLVKVHTRPGDTLLDFFAGSGTLGDAAAKNDRNAVLVDENPEAIAIMRERLAFAEPTVHQSDPASAVA